MIISKISEIKESVPIHRNMQFPVFKPFLNEAETELIELLSAEEYVKLKAGYNDGVTPNWAAYPQGEALLPKAQKFMSYRALQLGIWHIRNHVSEMGVQQQFTDDAGLSKPAPVEDVKKLELSYSKNAYKAADGLLEYLESNLDIAGNVFTDWKASASFSLLNNCFIRSAKELGLVIPALGSGQLFLALKAAFLEVQNDTVKATLGEEQFAETLAYWQQKHGKENLAGFSNAETLDKLIAAIQPVIAYHGLIKTLPFLSLTFEGDKVYLDTYDAGASKKDKATSERLSELKKRVQTQMELSLNKLEGFLAKNVEDLPLYEASDEWAAKNPDISENTIPENEGRPDFWIG